MTARQIGFGAAPGPAFSKTGVTFRQRAGGSLPYLTGPIDGRTIA
jgi:hypothetical protein